MELEQEVYEMAGVMLRQPVDGDGERALRGFCQAALDELGGRLRENVTPESIGGGFVRAAATLALSLYISAEAVSPAESFSAGSLSVRRRSSKSAAEAAVSLRRQAELMLTGYLRDSGFEFRAVRG